jgi:hypothetical protein
VTLVFGAIVSGEWPRATSRRVTDFEPRDSPDSKKAEMTPGLSMQFPRCTGPSDSLLTMLRINHMFRMELAKHHKLWHGNSHRREDTTMPAPATITDAQIHDAGQQIIATGRRVTGYSLREQLGGRGDPRRMLTVWQQTQPQRDIAPSDQPHTVAPPPLPLDLATHAAALRDRLAAEFDAVMATAWAVAQNRAAERLGSEVEAARAAARTAEQAQAEADDALAAADAARDAGEADRDRLAVEIVEVRAAADRAAGQRAAAEAERDRLVVELSQARQAIAEVERRTAAADAARSAAELAAKQAQEAAEAVRQAAEAERRAAAAEVATAHAQRDAAQETAAAALRQAQAEAEEARRALTAAAEERGRLLQRAEAAEGQRPGVTEATAPADGRPARSRGTRTGQDGRGRKVP